MRKILMTLGVLLAFFLIISSCEKQETSFSPTDVEESTFIENVFSQLFTDVEEAVTLSKSVQEKFINGYFFGFGAGGCVTVSIEDPEDMGYPKNITLSYGDGCACKESIKSGTILITLTDEAGKEGSQRIINFNDFYINGNQIEGTQTYTYLGNQLFSSKLENGRITTSDGIIITRESERNRELISGSDTEDYSDDIYQITGWAKGMDARGIEYQTTIIDPLIRSKDCFWITQGIIESIHGESTLLLEFGNGTCDNMATIQKNGGVAEELSMNFRINKLKGSGRLFFNQNQIPNHFFKIL